MSDLGRSIWAACLIGVVLALAVLYAIFKLFPSLPKDQVLGVTQVAILAAIGILLGIVRGVLPRIKLFRGLAPLMQRRLLSMLVMCAVAVSLACGALYYECDDPLRTLIASGYTWMLIALAMTHILDIGK